MAGADRAQVAVVGGGITGLAAAHSLVGDGVDVTVLEASDRLGGKVWSTSFAGLPSVECGADMFLVRSPAAVDLARAVGLAGDLVAPATQSAYVWSGGALHRLPAGLILGAPAALWPMARSGLLSWRGKARAAMEPLLPRGDAGDNLGAMIRARFGDEVLERLVGPLVGGINAGDPDYLSLRAVTPQLAEAQSGHRSLLLGLRAQSRTQAATGTGPPFLAPRSGMTALVERLAGAVAAGGGDIRLRAPVDGLEPQRGRWRLGVGGPSPATLDVDAVVLGIPAPDVAGLLDAVSAEAATTLRSIAYASVAMVTLAVPATAMARPLSGSGYLVPRSEQRTITACSWGSAKWAHWRVPGQVVLRVSAGRAGDEHALDLDDDALTAAVLSDLDRHVGLRGQPSEIRITRWWRSMPQYAPGHVERIDALMTAVHEDAPGLHLAGAAYRGLGLPACIAQGQAAARAVLATVGRR